MDDIYEFFKFAHKIIGLKKDVILNSGIFEFGNLQIGDSELLTLDESKDIIKIPGNKNKPISLDDIFRVLKKIKKQFKEIDEGEEVRSTDFTYKGIYKYDDHKYKINWCYE